MEEGINGMNRQKGGDLAFGLIEMIRKRRKYTIWAYVVVKRTTAVH
jgi:hypothetical protein